MNELLYSVNSFSFVRSLRNNKHDIYQYIDDSVGLGCDVLNPWFGHFVQLQAYEEHSHITPTEGAYIQKIKKYADLHNISFQIITVDGNTFVYDKDPAVRERNHENAKKWIMIAHKLGATGVRFDVSKTTEEDILDENNLNIISDKYGKLIDFSDELNIEIYFENHYGMTGDPDNVIKILKRIPRIKYLFDSWNWNHKQVSQAWIQCIPYADAVHIKTFYLNDKGEDALINVKSLCEILLSGGFQGCWTIETMPLGDDLERPLIKGTIAYLRKIIPLLQERNASPLSQNFVLDYQK